MTGIAGAVKPPEALRQSVRPRCAAKHASRVLMSLLLALRELHTFRMQPRGIESFASSAVSLQSSEGPLPATSLQKLWPPRSVNLAELLDCGATRHPALASERSRCHCPGKFPQAAMSPATLILRCVPYWIERGESSQCSPQRWRTTFVQLAAPAVATLAHVLDGPQLHQRDRVVLDILDVVGLICKEIRTERSQHRVLLQSWAPRAMGMRRRAALTAR